MSKKKIFDIEKVGFGDELSFGQRQENAKALAAKSELQRQKQDASKAQFDAEPRTVASEKSRVQSVEATRHQVNKPSTPSFREPVKKQPSTPTKGVERFKPQVYVSPIYGMRQLKPTKEVLTDEELRQKEKHKIEQLLKRYEHQSVLDLSSSKVVATTVVTETDEILSYTKVVSDGRIEPASHPVSFEQLTVVPEHILIEQSEPLQEDDILNLLELEESVKPHYYELPSLELLSAKVEPKPNLDDWIEEKMRLLEDVLAQYHIEAQVVGDFTENQRFVQLDVKLSPTVQVTQLVMLEDVMKAALNVAFLSVMVEMSQSSFVKVEIAKPYGERVRLREVLKTSEFMLHESPVYVGLGKDMVNEAVYADVLSMPHALIAGEDVAETTACLQTMLMSLLYKASPDEIQLLLIDSSRQALALYERMPHLIAPIVTDVSRALHELSAIVLEVERRYQLFEANGVRDVMTFNDRRLEFEIDHPKLPYVVVMIHDLAELMAVSMQETEDCLVQLTQKAHAAGIHLIVATQQVSPQVLTSAIKANMPARLSFAVKQDEASRTILDYSGAQQLLGEGDLLCVPNRKQQLKHLQLAVVTTEEIEAVMAFVRAQQPPHYEKFA